MSDALSFLTLSTKFERYGDGMAGENGMEAVWQRYE